MIGPGGGVATDSQGLVELTFPPGAVSTTVPVQITPLKTRKEFPTPLPDATATGYGVSALPPHSLELAVPVTIRFTNYRNIPTTLSIPLGTVDYETGGWDHVGLATWDAAVCGNHHALLELRRESRLGGLARVSAYSTVSTRSRRRRLRGQQPVIRLGVGATDRTAARDQSSRRGRADAPLRQRACRLATGRRPARRPLSRRRVARASRSRWRVPSWRRRVCPAGSSAPAGFCASGGACVMGMSPMVDLSWSKYMAGQLAEKNKQASQEVGGVGTGSYINLPPASNGKLPQSGYMVSDFVALFAGTTGGGGTCTGNGGGFAGSSTGSAEVTSLEPGPQVRHRSYELAYHRRTSALGAGWARAGARGVPDARGGSARHRARQRSARDLPRATRGAGVLVTALPYGGKAMARDWAHGGAVLRRGKLAPASEPRRHPQRGVLVAGAARLPRINGGSARRGSAPLRPGMPERLGRRGSERCGHDLDGAQRALRAESPGSGHWLGALLHRRPRQCYSPLRLGGRDAHRRPHRRSEWRSSASIRRRSRAGWPSIGPRGWPSAPAPSSTWPARSATLFTPSHPTPRPGCRAPRARSSG